MRGADFSMLKVWAGLEARSFLRASVERVSWLRDSWYRGFVANLQQVEACVKYDMLSPNI